MIVDSRPWHLIVHLRLVNVGAVVRSLRVREIVNVSLPRLDLSLFMSFIVTRSSYWTEFLFCFRCHFEALCLCVESWPCLLSLRQLTYFTRGVR